MLSVVDVQLTPGDQTNVATIAALSADEATETPAAVTLTADGPMSPEGYLRLLARTVAHADVRKFVLPPGQLSPAGPSVPAACAHCQAWQ